VQDGAKRGHILDLGGIVDVRLPRAGAVFEPLSMDPIVEGVVRGAEAVVAPVMGDDCDLATGAGVML
jgi:hypothetical protein